MDRSTIRITSDGEDTRVFVDGTEVADVISLDLMVDTESRTPVVTLGLRADVDLEAVGLPQVIREPTTGEVLKIAAEWLDGIDPSSVRTVLEGRAVTMRQDPIAGVIKVLAEAAREAGD